MNGSLEFARRYAELGWPCFPLTPGAQTPLGHLVPHGLLDATTDQEKIGRWYAEQPNAGVGLRTGDQFVAIDIDPPHGFETIETLQERLGPLPDTLVQRTPRGGFHRLYRPRPNIRNTASAIGANIDVRGHGGYICAEGTPGYAFLDWDVTGELPIIADLPDRWADALVAVQGGSKWKIPEGRRNDHLFKSASSLRGQGYDLAAIYAAIGKENAARCDPPLASAEVLKIAQSACRYRPDDESGIAPDEDGELELVIVNEDTLADRFAENRKDRIRFDCRSHRYHVWDGTRWALEKTGIAYHWCRRVVRAFNPDGKRQLARASTANGVEKYVQHDPRIAVSGEDWDADPFLLNTPAGTIELKTLETRECRQSDFITKRTLIAPQAGEAPAWRQFLRECTQGDAGVERLLQQLAGLCCTGDTSPQKLFTIYGVGGSGKTTFLTVISEILGDYAMTASMDTFTSSAHAKHPTDLASLVGARLVIASETEEGRGWDAQRVKLLTGGDRISVRLMRQDFFSYTPSFKVVIAGNHRPVLNTVDESWRRRLVVIPFMNRPKNPDDTLKQRLRDEYPFILNWMLDGCASWLRDGLIIPERVKAETDSYFETSDVLMQWLETCCDIGPHFCSANAQLYESYERHCRAAGESPGTSRAFADLLHQRGYQRIKDVRGIRGRGFAGLRVKPSADDYRRAADGE